MLTIGDVADLLNVSDHAVYKMLREGKLPFAFKWKNAWRFEQRDMRKWMKERALKK